MSKRLALGIFLVIISGVTPAIAEENHHQGLMSITFHNKKVNRTKSQSFHVVQDGGQVKWQNYKDREEPGTDPKKVYLLTEKQSVNKTPTVASNQQTARK